LLRFKTLRLSGFKSFVEGADLCIELGLTGIVGPNGCGKSNLVEALRWVMGETSAKEMRGGEMDDVIFGGTRDRPPRNIAEVILSLDNSARVAPAPFNEFDELEISRRIEKDKGSTYRINGREVRARDVQLLFADSATGARSTAMVSQGRIGAVIAAKPVERRLLLEEAAGITGLHSRRHEAELRLRGAETNLERLDDIMVTLEAQLAHLKKQARQATRYRNLSDHIRKAEATLFYLRWTADEEALEAASKALAEMGEVVAGLTGAVSSAAAAQADGADELPAKRQFEAEAAAELQRLTVARDGLEAEEQRINAASADGRVRLDETAADLQREQALITDGDAALKRLAEEKGRIDTPQEGEENARAEAAQDLAAANAQVEKLDDKLTGLTTEVANDEARRNGLALKIEDLKVRKERLTARGRDIAEQRERLETEVPDAAALAEAEWHFEDARTKLEQAQAGVDAAEQARTEAVGNTNATVAESHAAAASATRFEAQVEALAEVLDAGDDDRWPPLIDALGVEPGYEVALGVALGEDLTASDDEAAPSHWRARRCSTAGWPRSASSTVKPKAVGSPPIWRRDSA